MLGQYSICPKTLTSRRGYDKCTASKPGRKLQKSTQICHHTMTVHTDTHVQTGNPVGCFHLWSHLGGSLKRAVGGAKVDKRARDRWCTVWERSCVLGQDGKLQYWQLRPYLILTILCLNVPYTAVFEWKCFILFNLIYFLFIYFH